MMRALLDTTTAAVVIGVDFFRWYVGVSYESPREDIRMFVFRLGPIFLHVIHRNTA